MSKSILVRRHLSILRYRSTVCFLLTLIFCHQLLICPFLFGKLEHLPECIRTMNPDRAEKHCFPSECGSDSVGKEAFSAMLLQSGASMKYISDT